MKYKNGQPVEAGDVVHVRNRAYTVYSIGDTVTLRSMCERGYIKRVHTPLTPNIRGVDANMTISLVAAAVVILLILVFDL